MIKTIEKIQDVISDYVDLKFFKKFILVFSILYLINHCCLLVADPRHSIYLPFAAHNLNYVAAFVRLILHTCNIFAHISGLRTEVIYPEILKVENGAGIRIMYACTGLGMISFWIAIIMAQETKAFKKLFWCVIGGFSIFLVNCFRMTLLILARQNNWQLFRSIDHHTMFTIASYGVISILFVVYHRSVRYDSNLNA